MGMVECVGRDGQRRTFRYNCEKAVHEERWTFFVYTVPPLPSGEFYECAFEAIDTRTVRSVAMHAHAPEYRRVGLPETMLLEAALVLGKRVVSSRNKGERANNERRHVGATRVWERLKHRGFATLTFPRFVVHGES